MDNQDDDPALKKARRSFRAYYSSAIWIPLVAYVLLIVFAGISFLRIGDWPHNGHPDPKELGLPVLHGGSLVGLLLAHLVLVVGSVALVASTANWKQGLAYVGFVVLAIVVLLQPAFWPDYVQPLRQFETHLPLIKKLFLVGVLIARVSFLVAVTTIVVSRSRRKELHTIAFVVGAFLWALETFRHEHLFIWLID